MDKEQGCIAKGKRERRVVDGEEGKLEEHQNIPKSLVSLFENRRPRKKKIGDKKYWRHTQQKNTCSGRGKKKDPANQMREKKKKQE